MIGLKDRKDRFGVKTGRGRRKVKPGPRRYEEKAAKGGCVTGVKASGLRKPTESGWIAIKSRGAPLPAKRLKGVEGPPGFFQATRFINAHRARPRSLAVGASHWWDSWASSCHRSKISHGYPRSLNA